MKSKLTFLALAFGFSASALFAAESDRSKIPLPEPPFATPKNCSANKANDE